MANTAQLATIDALLENVAALVAELERTGARLEERLDAASALGQPRDAMDFGDFQMDMLDTLDLAAPSAEPDPAMRTSSETDAAGTVDARQEREALPSPQQEVQDALIATQEQLTACHPPLAVAAEARESLAAKVKSLGSGKARQWYGGMGDASRERTLKRRKQVRQHLNVVQNQLRQLSLLAPTEDPSILLERQFAAQQYDGHRKLLRMALPGLRKEYADIDRQMDELQELALQALGLLAQYGDSLPVPVPGLGSIDIPSERLESIGDPTKGVEQTREQREATLNLLQSPLASFIQRTLRDTHGTERFEDLSAREKVDLTAAVEAQADGLTRAMVDAMASHKAVRSTQKVRSASAALKATTAVVTLAGSGGLDITGYIRLMAALHDVVGMIAKEAKSLETRAKELTQALDDWNSGDLVNHNGKLIRELRVFLEDASVATLQGNPVGVLTASARALMDFSNDHAHLREHHRQHGSATALLQMKFQTAFSGLETLLKKTADFENYARTNEPQVVQETFLRFWTRERHLDQDQIVDRLVQLREKLNTALENLVELGARLIGDDGHIYLQIESGTVMRKIDSLTKTYTAVHDAVQTLAPLGSLGSKQTRKGMADAGELALRQLEEAQSVLSGVHTDIQTLSKVAEEVSLVVLAEMVFASLSPV